MTISFNGKTFTLNQCEDIWKWFQESLIGEYTHYYCKVVLHTENGFYAADSDNLNNGCFI